MNSKELKLPGVKNIEDTILKDGIHIGNRRGLFCQIALFQIENYYVEVFFDAKTKEVSRAVSFTNTEMLEPYLKQVDISGLLN